MLPQITLYITKIIEIFYVFYELILDLGILWRQLDKLH